MVVLKTERGETRGGVSGQGSGAAIYLLGDAGLVVPFLREKTKGKKTRNQGTEIQNGGGGTGCGDELFLWGWSRGS